MKKSLPLITVFFLTLFLPFTAWGADCAAWNSRHFFEEARVGLVKKCLSAGANINARTKGGGIIKDEDGEWVIPHGVTPLHWAANFSKNPNVVKALIKAGADINARDEFDNIALHWVAYNEKRGAVRMIKILVKAGSDINARTSGNDGIIEGTTEMDIPGGMTPLHLAAWFNANPLVVRALLDAGADIKARDKTGKTPFDYAQRNPKLKGTDVYRRLRGGE